MWICAASNLGLDLPTQLTNEEYELGRSSSCSIVIRDASISRRHARLLRKDETVIVEDLQSRNGTFLNGLAVKSAKLAVGDLLVLGAVPLLLTASPLTPAQIAQEIASTVKLRYQPTRFKADTGDLTPAQTRVLRFLLDGLDEKAIGARCDTSPRTVHNHIQAIYRTLEVNSRHELLVRFLGQASLKKNRLSNLAES